jgi:hypothetical protein
MYKGRVEFSVKEALYVLYVAKVYEVDALVSKCRQFVNDNLSKENAVDLWHSADALGENDIVENCRKIIATNTDTFVKSKVSEISFEILLQVLKMDRVSVEEVELFKLCNNWILHHDPPKEKKAEILDLLRIPVISAQDLSLVVAVSNLVPPDTIIEAFRYQSVPNIFTENKQKKFQKRLPLKSSLDFWWDNSKSCGASINGKILSTTTQGISFCNQRLDPLKNYYWEIKISEPANLACTLGVARYETNAYKWYSYGFDKKGWGLYLNGGFSHDGNVHGDTSSQFGAGLIGIGLSNKGKLSIYKNKKLFAMHPVQIPAFEDLYPAVAHCATNTTFELISFQIE